ncbi:MAG: hypothetical protein IPI48_09610 [bacterium]|nr:hypothetical protein [bacterium]
MQSANNVSVGGRAGVPDHGLTCVSLPVTFNRLDTLASRGVSVTFQLSPELVLCTGVPSTSITMATGVGSWSSGFSNLCSRSSTTAAARTRSTGPSWARPVAPRTAAPCSR